MERALVNARQSPPSPDPCQLWSVLPMVWQCPGLVLPLRRARDCGYYRRQDQARNQRVPLHRAARLGRWHMLLCRQDRPSPALPHFLRRHAGVIHRRDHRFRPVRQDGEHCSWPCSHCLHFHLLHLLQFGILRSPRFIFYRDSTLQDPCQGKFAPIS